MALVRVIAVLAACACAASLDHATLVGPLGVAPDMDCTVRWLASNFSAHLLPWADPTLAFDALRLAADCNGTLAPARAAAPLPLPALSAAAFYVDAVHGSDSNAGSLAAPFKTIPRGLVATRAAAPPAQLVLRAGVYTLAAPIELTPADSQLTISAYPGDASPVVSGGVSLGGLAWTPLPPPAPSPPPAMTPTVVGSILGGPTALLGDCVSSPGDSDPNICSPLGQLPTAAACAAACNASLACTGFTWHDETQGEWAHWCYVRPPTASHTPADPLLVAYPPPWSLHPSHAGAPRRLRRERWARWALLWVEAGVQAPPPGPEPVAGNGARGRRRL